MRTITGCRTFAPRPLTCIANLNRRFFPSTEELEIDDWEEVEAGETAENGPVSKEEGGSAMEEAKAALPDVPTAEPTEDGPATKKLKPNGDDGEKL